MKLIERQQIAPKKQNLQPHEKDTFLYSYGEYLEQRKQIPYKISYNRILDYHFKAKKYTGKPLNNFFLLLEHRLDTTLYRIQFAQSILQARQQIHHNKIFINGNLITSPGYLMKPGDILKIDQPNKIQQSQNEDVFLVNFKRLGTRIPFQGLNQSKSKSKANQKRKISNQVKKQRPTYVFRPLNYEINFVTGTAIFLYPPQKLYYSQRLYPDFIRRSYKHTL